MMKKKIVIYIAIALLLVLVGFLLGGSRCRVPSNTIVVQTDTIVVRDTHIVERPVYIRKKITDTVLVAVTDTLRLRDTLYVPIPKEVKVYANEDYYAEVSGYQPSLDYLEIYQKTTTISKTEIPKEKKNYIAVGMEAGWCLTFSFPLYLQYERKVHRNVSVYGGVFRDVVRQENGVWFGANANIGW